MIDILNRIIESDAYEFLIGIPDSSVDLVYIDPPFNTGQEWEGRGGLKYSDKFGDHKIDFELDKKYSTFLSLIRESYDEAEYKYLSLMIRVLIELHRVLKDTGSIYYHCDWRNSQLIRVMIDLIFGKDNFRNDIIWCYQRCRSAKKSFKRIHDVIYFYNKDFNKSKFNKIKIAKLPDKAKHKVFIRGGKKVSIINRLDKELGSWWDTIPSFGTATNSKERVGYPTQKPIKLLERIIQASSNKGDLVLDCFMGSGTTAMASIKLGRDFIGCDKNKQAVELANKRLADFNDVLL